MLQCLCIIYLNTVKVIKKQQLVYGIIIEINQVMPFQLIPNLSNTRQVLQGILIMLTMMMIIMTQIKLVRMKPKLLFH